MKKRIILIGGYSKARFLSVSLINKGYSVTAINDDMEKCKFLTEIDKLTVFYGDGTKQHVLNDADIYNADIAIALTDKDEDDLVICQLCKKVFNIKKTVAIASDPSKYEFFRHMGIDSVICEISIISGIIENEILGDV